MSNTPNAPAISLGTASDTSRTRRSSYEMLKLIEETGTVGFWSLDLTTGAFEASAGCLRLLGLAGKPMPESMTLRGLIHPDDRAANADIWAVLKCGFGIDRQLRILRANGTTLMVRARAEVHLDHDNRPARADGLLTDITELNAVRAVSAHSLERYQDLIEITSCIVWQAAPDGRLLSSDGWIRLTGQTLAEHLGEGWMAAVHPGDRERVAAEWRGAFAEPSRIDVEFRVLCRDGVYRWHHCRLIPRYNRDGSISEWFGGLTELREHLDPPPLTGAGVEGHLSGSMVRAARGALNWSIADLAEASGLSASTIKRLEEHGSAPLRSKTSRIVCRSFEDNGVAFLVTKSGEKFIRI